MAPVPKPTAQHIKDGTYRKHRHYDRMDADFAGAFPEKPTDLDAKASWLWDFIQQNFPSKHQAQIDGAELEAACRWWSIWDKYMRQLETCKRTKDEYRLMIQAGTAWKHCINLLSKYGMSPADRVRIRSAPKEVGKKNENDPLSVLRMMRDKTA